MTVCMRAYTCMSTKRTRTSPYELAYSAHTIEFIVVVAVEHVVIKWYVTRACLHVHSSYVRVSGELFTLGSVSCARSS